MKMSEFAELVIRLTGLVFIALKLTSVIRAIGVFSQLLDPEGRESIWLGVASLVPPVALILVGIGLILWSKFLARLISAGLSQDAAIPCSMEAVKPWSITLAGLIIAAVALPMIGRGLSWRIMQRQFDETSSMGDWERTQLVGGILQLLVGLALFFGAAGIRGIRNYFRNLGIKKPA
jgi:hypothetical protein